MSGGNEPPMTDRRSVPDLIATCWTTAGNVRADQPDNCSLWPLEQRIEAAARAGYTGFGFWLGDLRLWRERGGDYATLRAHLSDAGLTVIELEYLAEWFADGELRLWSDAARSDLFRAADELGARHVKVMPPFGGQGRNIDDLAEHYAALCKDAARYGLQMALEMIPFSDLPDLPSALELVMRANAPNGGLLIDIWHVVRSGGRVEDVADVPLPFIKAVELCDADRSMRGPITEDTMRYRHLCGEGEFDLPSFIAAVESTGYAGPYGVEILSDALRALPLEDAARRSYETAAAQFHAGSPGRRSRAGAALNVGDRPARA
ncbi:sugar phosphate isomerase/epimerase family protein [Sphingobium estronivorans]|uniref:sugar phosphate isomerase/epimerase family protein n=1 Tax=Sphingobium estronivorans TaxID=1577690 RepID=UPI001F077C23|nr:sugar phosphate isomerase/epimerase [Sphingobium estronivorans]